MVFTASLLGAQQVMRSVKKKPASLLVVSLGKTLNGTPQPLCGRQVAITVSVIIKNYKNQIKITTGFQDLWRLQKWVGVACKLVALCLTHCVVLRSEEDK